VGEMTDEENEELKKILASSPDEIEISVIDLQNGIIGIGKAIEESIQPLLQSMEIIYDKYYLDFERPPEEIKRDIKHERNPMRLKQLQKELNSSYVYWRKKK
jgi:hypothetical protein